MLLIIIMGHKLGQLILVTCVILCITVTEILLNVYADFSHQAIQIMIIFTFLISCMYNLNHSMSFVVPVCHVVSLYGDMYDHHTK
jgi:hypothetical protein